jgi:amino acid adenylation domain-containing protein
MTETLHLSSGFLKSVAAFGDRPAIEVSGQVLTYTELFQKAASIAATLSEFQIGHEPALTAVFAYRSVTAFSGILAALLRGHGYVPLNCTFPPERTRSTLQRSGCRAMIVDGESEKQLEYILGGIEQDLAIILPERECVRELAVRWPRHRFFGVGELCSHQNWRPPKVSSDSIAYLLFTSGSTGVPKGVMVSHRNVRTYIDFMTDRLGVNQEDRFSQNADMTFDLSVPDLFLAWERGACVCCPSARMLINLGKFIKDTGITIWCSVPSIAVFMKRLGALKPGMYPSLRASLFCGEALPMEVAKAWAEAAPNSIVENIYGPTELTIACTYYRWDPVTSPSESEQGVVPIGEPFPGMVPMIVDEALNEVKSGEDGELLMTGPQLSLGYWCDTVRTNAAFIKPPGKEDIYYRTGDRVRIPREGAPMLYLGRIDHQIKIMGHRVELGEVEFVVREESGVDGVVALGWPLNTGGANGLEVFLQSEASPDPDLKQRVARRLPDYMTPRRFHSLPAFPLNVNGKFDRVALLNILNTK